MSDQDKEDVKEVIESIKKRLNHLQYLIRIYGNEKATVFNCMRFSSEDFNTQTAEDRTFLVGTYYLTYSFHRFLDEKSEINLLTSLAQLCVEYEFFLSSPTLKKMRLVRAKDLREVAALKPQEDHSAFVMPVLVKSNSRVIYQCLRTPFISMDLEFCSVLYSLCDVLTHYYNLFLSLDYFKYPDYIKFVTFIDSHVYRLLTSFDKRLISMSEQKIKHVFDVLNPFSSEPENPSYFYDV